MAATNKHQGVNKNNGMAFDDNDWLVCKARGFTAGQEKFHIYIYSGFEKFATLYA